MPAKPKQRQYRMMASTLSTIAAPQPAPQPVEGEQPAPEPMPQQPAQPQKRFDTKYYVEGYATTFEDPYLLFEDSDGWKYYEIIERGAFDGADMSDIIMQYDHSGYVYARIVNNSLLVEPDDHGLFVAADMGLTTHSRHMYEDIASGNVNRMSWAFIPAEESFESDFENKVSTARIKRVSKVFDVSAVSMPADPNTEISARVLFDGVIEERKKQELLRIAATRKRKEIALKAKAMSIR